MEEGFDLDFLKDIFSSSQLDPVDYQYFKSLIKDRTIIFNGEVNEDLIETVYLPLKEFEKDDNDSPITLIMNSCGGSVSDSLFFADYLTTYKKKLNIIVTGYAASMAAILLCGGGKNDNITRWAYPSTYFLIHDGMVALGAQEAKTANDIIAFNNEVDNYIKNFVIRNTNISEKLYESKARKQWFFFADEAKKLGLIDKIYGVDDCE